MFLLYVYLMMHEATGRPSNWRLQHSALLHAGILAVLFLGTVDLPSHIQQQSLYQIFAIMINPCKHTSMNPILPQFCNRYSITYSRRCTCTHQQAQHLWKMTVMQHSMVLLSALLQP